MYPSGMPSPATVFKASQQIRGLCALVAPSQAGGSASSVRRTYFAEPPYAKSGGGRTILIY